MAFRGTYMKRIRLFLEESDDTAMRASHRRRARTIATRMSRTDSQETRSREPDSSSQPSTSRRPGSRAQRSAPAAAVAATSVTAKVLRSLRNSSRTIPALMDLALPKFAHPEKWSGQPRSPWIVMSEVPASPAVSLRVPLRSPSPCLDTLSSDGSVGPGDISEHPILFQTCLIIPAIRTRTCRKMTLQPEVRVVDLPTEAQINNLSPEVRMKDLPPELRVVDLPPEAQSNNFSPEVRMNDLPPGVRFVDLPPKVRINDLQPEVRVVELLPEVRIIYLPLGVCAFDFTPEDCVVDLPSEGRVDAGSTAVSPGSERMSPCSPLVVFLDQSVVSPMVISPNRVRLDTSPDTPDTEAMLGVSPGFL